jgi:hypothetical protein
MIFSAVALMAFSFAGFANEIEEKKELKKELNTCDKVAESTYNLWMTAGASETYAYTKSLSAYKDCLANDEIKL